MPPTNDRLSAFVRYGVATSVALPLVAAGLTLTGVRSTTAKVIAARAKISLARATQVKRFVRRDPIEANVVDLLLQRSAFVCCCCQGASGDQGYVIHHIEEHAETQDNSYGNLAVVCLHHHDKAHAGGLTRHLSPRELKSAKRAWESKVEARKVAAAATEGEVHELDYLNLRRIEEMGAQLQLPPLLISKRDPDVRNVLTRREPLLSLVSTFAVRRQYFNLFKRIMQRVSFRDLHEMLKVVEVTSGTFVGTHCVFVGGIWCRGLRWPITPGSPPARLSYRRRQFRVHWHIDPMLIVSSTALVRLSRGVAAVYGKVKNVQVSIEKGKRIYVIDVMPYVVADPLQWRTGPVLPHQTRDEDLFETI